MTTPEERKEGSCNCPIPQTAGSYTCIVCGLPPTPSQERKEGREDDFIECQGDPEGYCLKCKKIYERLTPTPSQGGNKYDEASRLAHKVAMRRYQEKDHAFFKAISGFEQGGKADLMEQAQQRIDDLQRQIEDNRRLANFKPLFTGGKAGEGKEWDWHKHGERADFYAPEAIVYPQNIVDIIVSNLLTAEREKLDDKHRTCAVCGVLEWAAEDYKLGCSSTGGHQWKDDDAGEGKEEIDAAFERGFSFEGNNDPESTPKMLFVIHKDGSKSIATPEYVKAFIHEAVRSLLTAEREKVAQEYWNKGYEKGRDAKVTNATPESLIGDFDPFEMGRATERVGRERAKGDGKAWGECASCGQTTVLVEEVGLCGPCCFGEAETINGNF